MLLGLIIVLLIGIGLVDLGLKVIVSVFRKAIEHDPYNRKGGES